MPSLAAVVAATLYRVASSRAAWLIPLVLLLGACGPTARESGHSILLMAPLITVAGGSIAVLFRLLWQPMVPSLPLSFRRCRNAILLLTLPCLPLAFDPALNDDWIGTALVAVGSTYLTLLLLAIRLIILAQARHLFAHIIYVPWLLLYPGAAYYAYGGSTTAEASEFHMNLWILPGYFGIFAGALFLLLLLEVFIRRHLHFKRLAEEALPRPLPVATAIIR